MKRAKGERVQHLSRLAYRARRITFTFINARRCINTKRVSARALCIELERTFYKHLRHPLPAITSTATFTVLNLEPYARQSTLTSGRLKLFLFRAQTIPTRLPMNEILRFFKQAEGVCIFFKWV